MESISFVSGMIAGIPVTLSLSQITNYIFVNSNRPFIRIDDVDGNRYLVHSWNNPNFDLIRIRLESRSQL